MTICTLHGMYSHEKRGEWYSLIAMSIVNILLAERTGIEPVKCQSQSLVSYRLATDQFVVEFCSTSFTAVLIRYTPLISLL